MKPINPTIDLDWLRKHFSYNREDGLITHTVTRQNVRAGQIAGNLEASGYVRVNVRGNKILAHRLAFLIETGSWPSNEIDHINRDRSDNRWANLREATSSENNRNKAISIANTSGVTGVQWRPTIGKWQAVITVDRKRRSLGHFESFQAAVEARCNAERAISIASKAAA